MIEIAITLPALIDNALANYVRRKYQDPADNSEGLVVLSLFDGMSCGYIALERAGIKIKKYYASEIDKYASAVSERNYPNVIRLGDVTKVRAQDLDRVDLVIGGSPCQGFSSAGDGLNFEDPRSKLFFDYVRLVEECRAVNPDLKFLLENVKMKSDWEDVITKYMGVSPVKINSNLVSAQNRTRLYWTNIAEIPQPEDRGIFLRDVLEKNPDPKYDLSKNAFDYMTAKTTNDRIRWSLSLHADSANDKSQCLVANLYKGAPNNVLIDRGPGYIRTDRKGRVKSIQEKSSCLTIGGNGNGDHSDSDILIITEKTESLVQRERGFNKGGFVGTDEKSYPVTANSWQQNHTLVSGVRVRKLTPLECERLQTVPEGYTQGVSDSQRYRMIGNGWTVDAIAHILSFLKPKI